MKTGNLANPKTINNGPSPCVLGLRLPVQHQIAGVQTSARMMRGCFNLMEGQKMPKIKPAEELLKLNHAGRTYAGLMTEKELQHSICCKEFVKPGSKWKRRAIDIFLSAAVVSLMWYVVFQSGMDLIW